MVENGKVMIYAMLESETEDWIEFFRKKGYDVSKCHVCGTPIERTEREPRYLREKILRVLTKKKFYSWNIGGFDQRGVFCESIRCLLAERNEHV